MRKKRVLNSGTRIGLPSTALLAAFLTGCCLSKSEQLEAVARDWCMTIRASQVIPVYPLTEDLQPGDVFLVQVPVDKQQSIYKKKGFLPLDNHLARINPKGYTSFYDHSFLAGGTSTTLPNEWIRPKTAGGWELAPNAAFPTYSFSVRRGAGLNMAIPVNGVPVGLSLLGSDSADGSISIERSRTMGLDTISLYRELQEWAVKNADFLAHFAPGKDGKPRNFLRVVTRVYATGRLDILLNDASSASGGLDVGVPRPVDLMVAEPPTGPSDIRAKTLDNYRAGLSKLNAMIAESYQPARASGSRDDLSTPQNDEKTKKLMELRAERLEDLKEALADAQKTYDEEVAGAAKPKLEELTQKRKDLMALEAEIAAEEDPRKRADLEERANEARSSVEALEGSAELVKLAQLQGSLEFAKASLGEITKVLPGGSLRVTAAASRTIALQQKFDPPLILGYLGFDVAIGAGGALGRPVPTHALIDPESQGGDLDATEVIEALYRGGLPTEIYDELVEKALARDRDAKNLIVELDGIANQFLPQKFTRYTVDPHDAALLIESERDYTSSDKRTFPAYRQHRSDVHSSIVYVETALQQPAFSVRGAQGVQLADAPMRDRLTKSLEAWKRERDDVVRNIAYGRVSANAATYYVRLLLKDEK